MVFMEIDPMDDSFPIFSLQNEPVVGNSSPNLHKQPFVSVFLHLKEMIKKALVSTTETRDDFESFDSLFETCPNDISDETETQMTSLDIFHFGAFLRGIKLLKENGQFLSTIQDRRNEIYQQKEYWRHFIEKRKLGKDSDFYTAIDEVLKKGSLLPNSSGCGSAYFLVDGQGIARYVVKPIDEDIFCLNNRKEFASIFNDEEHRVREDIPLYRSAQTDAFCSDVAFLAGLETVTPRAVMGILKEDGFFDFTHWIASEEKDHFIAQTGLPDFEKLASIQEFIPDSQDLIEVLHDFYKEGLSDEEITSRFDQKNFEEVCLFLWLSYDTDAHGGNFLAFVKGIDENGEKIYGIKKIDNGLSFPEKNTRYVNILSWAPNAILPISQELKQKIANLPTEQILSAMDDYGLSSCKEAFMERLEIMKELAQREEMTLGEVDLRLTFFSYEQGKELALSPMTTQQILDLLIGKAATTTDATPTQEALTLAGPHEAA